MFIVTVRQLLSHWFDNGLQLNPAISHVDFELEAMNVLKEIFRNVSIKCYRFHLVKVWWEQIQKFGLSQEYKRSKQRPWNQKCPQFCW